MDKPSAEEIHNRTFPIDGDFGAYSACVRWLDGLGFSVGSMQRGSPTAVFFEPDCLVSKNRNLGKDREEVHGWIVANGDRFRNTSVTFSVTQKGRDFLEKSGS